MLGVIPIITSIIHNTQIKDLKKSVFIFIGLRQQISKKKYLVHH
jgi:hypothetical protein